MTPPENVLSPRSEGTAWIVELEQNLITIGQAAQR